MAEIDLRWFDGDGASVVRREAGTAVELARQVVLFDEDGGPEVSTEHARFPEGRDRGQPGAEQHRTKRLGWW